MDAASRASGSGLLIACIRTCVGVRGGRTKESDWTQEKARVRKRRGVEGVGGHKQGTLHTGEPVELEAEEGGGVGLGDVGVAGGLAGEVTAGVGNVVAGVEGSVAVLRRGWEGHCA